jgi:hypothetical protein
MLDRATIETHARTLAAVLGVEVSTIREVHDLGVEICFRADAPVPMYCCTIIEPDLPDECAREQLADAAERALDAVMLPSPLPTARLVRG